MSMQPWRRGSSFRLVTAAVGLTMLLGACAGGSSAPPAPGDHAALPPTIPDQRTTATSSPETPTTSSSGRLDDLTPSVVYGLGRFPEFPSTALQPSIAAALQATLDAAVARGTFTGVTAAVVVGSVGHWSGTAGSWNGSAVSIDSRHPTHSAAKTIVAAQVLRLAEDGMLDLDEPASEHLPPELGFFDANGATIRQVLAMRSGIPDLDEEAGYYPAELVADPVELFGSLAAASVAPDTVTRYASTNFVLLGTIIEHAKDRPLADVLRSDVLAHTGLEGISYTVGNAMASDGWGVETTAASLARWGYSLYGGTILTEESLKEMTDFQHHWYGLGVMDFSSEYHTYAVGHQGLSSVTTCCSAIILLALPDEAIVIAVQANTDGTTSTNADVDRLAGDLWGVVSN